MVNQMSADVNSVEINQPTEQPGDTTLEILESECKLYLVDIGCISDFGSNYQLNTQQRISTKVAYCFKCDMSRETYHFGFSSWFYEPHD